MTTPNAELVELVTIQAKDLLAQIRKDIEETTALTEKDRENCMTICQRVEAYHTRLTIEFLRTSSHLIDQALETSDQEKLRQIHQAWSLALENVTHQCENLAGPLIEVLRILSRHNPKMESRYAVAITGTVVSSILAGVAIGVIIVYHHPDYLLRLGRENILAVAIAPFLAIVCATAYVTEKITSTNLQTVYRRWLDFARSILAKYLPNYIDSPVNDTSELNAVMMIKNSIDKLNINEDIWHNHEALEMIKRSVQYQLQRLQESK